MPSKTAEVVALTTERMDHKGRIDAVIAEFGGDVDAAAALTRMAEEIRQPSTAGRGPRSSSCRPASRSSSRNWPPPRPGGSGGWLCPRARFLVADLRKRFEATPARRVTRAV